MQTSEMFSLVSQLAEAKGRQDVQAAMRVQHQDMLLETPAFGATAKGHVENEAALKRFFKSFPNYHVTLSGHAGDGATLVCWGNAHMTLTGDRFGVTPNGRRANLPASFKFTFKDELIASEWFLFDLAELCAQSGVSTDVVRAKLFGSRHRDVAA